MSFKVLLRRQNAFAITESRGHRKTVFHSFWQPRWIVSLRFAEERFEPLQPEPRRLLNFRDVRFSNFQSQRNDNLAGSRRTQRSVEPSPIGNARDHQIKECKTLAIQSLPLLGDQRLK